MTTASSPGPLAASQQLVWNIPAGNPATSMRDPIAAA
jgi:hypothetical protein